MGGGGAPQGYPGNIPGGSPSLGQAGGPVTPGLPPNLAGAQPADPNATIPSSGPNPSKQETAQMLDAASKKYGIPPNLLRAIAYKESGWNANAVGDGGKSNGMMQIYSAAHPDYDVERGKADPSYNIEYGAKLLAGLHNQTGDWRTAARRYNGAGPMAERYADSVMQISQEQPWKQWGV